MYLSKGKSLFLSGRLPSFCQCLVSVSCYSYKRNPWVPKDLNTKFRKNLIGTYKQRKRTEIINTSVLTDQQWHITLNNWELKCTTPSNPYKWRRVNYWQPVTYLRKSRGHTAGSFHSILPDLSLLWTSPSSALTIRIIKSGGRYWWGRRNTGGKGGKCTPKYWYRKIDFKHSILDELGIVERIEFNPMHSSHIAFIRYPLSNRIQYINSVYGLKPGDSILSTHNTPKMFNPGCSMKLKYIPEQCIICNIGGTIARAAGSYGKLINKNNIRRGYALIEMPSKELKLFNLECMATLGRVSNINWSKINWGTCGNKRRWMGTRPKVKGVSMNANDHPHGGGTSHKRKVAPKYGSGTNKTGWIRKNMPTRPIKKDRVPIQIQNIVSRKPNKGKPGQLFRYATKWKI